MVEYKPGFTGSQALLSVLQLTELEFGDMNHAPRVSDIAVSAAETSGSIRSTSLGSIWSTGPRCRLRNKAKAW